MVKTHSVVNKAAALAMLPALTLGIFAMPALTFGSTEGVTTVITTTNINSAQVSNNLTVKADTGDNSAIGGDGADGGDSGNSGSGAGNGGEGGEGGEGGDADANKGGYAAGGDGAEGGDAGEGGNTGDTGNAGNGGDGGIGGFITTGDATAVALVSNTVNYNNTEVTLPEDCGCDRYNEYYEAADSYYTRYQAEKSHERRSGHSKKSRYNRGGGSSSHEAVAEESKEDHWVAKSKEYVPVTTIITTTNINDGNVENNGEVKADTGDNVADGGYAGEGGDSGTSGSGAGNGGDGGEGGEGGDAEIGDSKHMKGFVYGKRYHRSWNNDNGGEAIGGDGAEGGDGADGGNTGDTGEGGDGGFGGDGGVIVTGHANSAAGIENFVNINNLSISRVTD